MKVTIKIDCSPEEARSFFGLPDVAPAQEAFVEALRKRMGDAIAGMDTNDLFKAWSPQGMPGWEQWRKMWPAGEDGQK